MSELTRTRRTCARGVQRLQNYPNRDSGGTVLRGWCWILHSGPEWTLPILQLICLKERCERTRKIVAKVDKEVDKENEMQAAAGRLYPKRYSDSKHLIRIYARVNRVLTNMRDKQKRQQSRIELMPDEIRDAEDVVIRQAEKEAFSAEYEALSKGRPIPKKSQIAKLSPRIDQQGGIRCDSRLYYAEYLHFDARCPVILPRGHWVILLFQNI